MAGLEDIPNPFGFLFNANAAPGSPSSYAALDMRRKVALAMMMQNKKGFPKNVGEGLTAIGDALGERLTMNQLAQQEAAYQKTATEAAAGAVPGEARSDTGTGARMSYAPSDDGAGDAAVATAAPAAPITPAAPVDPNAPASFDSRFNASFPRMGSTSTAEPGVSDGGYNMIDAQAGMKRAGQGRVQDAVMSAYPGNPDMQAYASQLAAGEQQVPGDTSRTGARGPWQFIPSTARQYGLTNPDDPRASAQALKSFTANNAAIFERINGRPPTMAELAVMHQQGGQTGASMIAGTGNASPRNLALNNVPSGAGPEQAAQRIKNYYGMPDRPVNPRDGAAQILAARNTAQAVPPPNPISTGDPTMPPMSPMEQPPPPSTPELVGEPAQGLAPDQRMAFAGLPPEISQGASAPPPAPPAPAQGITAAPPIPSQLQAAPPTQVAQNAMPSGAPPATPQRLEPQERMPLPTDVKMSEDLKRGYQLQAKGLALGDDNMARQGKALIDYGTDQRNQEYNARLKDWQDKMLERRQRQQSEEAFARTQGTPEHASEVAIKATEARIAQKFGGPIAYQQFNQDMSKGHDAIQPLANTLPMYDQAKSALKNAYTGTGAEAKLDFNKMLRGMGVPGDYSPSEATEILRSRMSAIAAGFVKGTVGAQNISNQDVAFVEKAYSGKIDMEPGSLRKLLNIAQEAAIKTVNQHNDRLLRTADDPAADKGLRNMYRVPMQYGEDANILKQQGQDPKIRKYFDEKYGKGHADAVLRGVAYGD